MTETRTPIGTLAQALLALSAAEPDQALDLLDGVEAVTPLLRPGDERDLYLALDLCPAHHRDIDACAEDDTPECRTYRLAHYGH